MMILQISLSHDGRKRIQPRPHIALHCVAASTMAEFSTPSRAGQRSPRGITDLVAPRVTPRVRKTPTKHIVSPTETNSSPVHTRSSLRNATPQDTVINDSDLSWYERKTRTTAPVDTDDSSLAVSEVNTEAPSQVHEDDGSHAEDAWEQVQARSQGIKSRMLLSAQTAAEMKAAAAAAAAAAEKKPEPTFGRVVEIITSGEMCHATAEWLSPQNHTRASSSMDHQENDDIVDVLPTAVSAASYTLHTHRSTASLLVRETDNHSPESQSVVVEDAVPETQQFTSVTTKSFEEVLTVSSSASSCSSSTGGALNSYSSPPINSDNKSAADETAVTLQTIQEDDATTVQHHDKAVKRVLWKRLFRSKPQSTSDGASVNENPTSSDILDDIHLHVAAPFVRESSYPEDELDPDFADAEEEEETGVETVLFRPSSETHIEDFMTTSRLSTQLASMEGVPKEEHPPLLGAVSSESSSGSKSSEEKPKTTKPSLLRRVLQGSPSKNIEDDDDDDETKKQSTLISF